MTSIHVVCRSFMFVGRTRVLITFFPRRFSAIFSGSSTAESLAISFDCFNIFFNIDHNFSACQAVMAAHVLVDNAFSAIF